MIGRFVRVVVALVVLVAAVDLWEPGYLPYRAPVNLGDFEDLRDVIAAILGVVGLTFFFAAIWPPARKRKRTGPAVLSLDDDTPPPPPAAAPIAWDLAPIPEMPIAAAQPAPTLAESAPADSIPFDLAPTPVAEPAAVEPAAPEPVAATRAEAEALEPFIALHAGPPPAPTLVAANDEPVATDWDMSPVEEGDEAAAPYEEPHAIDAPEAPAILVAAAAPLAVAAMDHQMQPGPIASDWAPNSEAALDAAPEPSLGPTAVEATPEPALEAIVAQPMTKAEPIAVSVATGGRSAFVATTEAGDKARLGGVLDDAMEHYDHALEMARANLRVAPGDPQARADLAGALTNVGDIHDEQGRLEPAISAHEESLTLRRLAAADAPHEKAALRSLSLGLERLADTREARGHRSRALDLYQESLPLAERLAVEHPDDPLYARDVEVTRVRLNQLQSQMAPAVVEMSTADD